MTGIEIASLIEAGAELAIKIIQLIQAAQKGDVAAAEALKRITEGTARNDASTDELHEYLGKKFEG